MLTGGGAAYAASALVPNNPPVVVEEDYLGIVTGLIPGSQLRNTCDPDFMTVLENRAWEEAQREITQNANIISRPDSVLSYTCFDSWINHLAWYAENNFPGDPQYSDGDLLNGLLTDLVIIGIDDILTGIDSGFTDGYVIYGMLELLVLDQLVDINSTMNDFWNGVDLTMCLADGGKFRFIEDGFPGLMIGNRAKDHPAQPSYTQINASLASGVSQSQYNGCARMNSVWQRTKCYDVAMEAPYPPVLNLAANPPATYRATATNYTGTNHDGFYTLQQYRDNATVSNSDFRTEANQCARPDDDLINLSGSGTQWACWIQAHGIPSFPATSLVFSGLNFSGNQSLPGSVPNPTWDTAHTAAFPPPGGTGAMDLYVNYLTTVSGNGGTCAAPIQIGFQVRRNNVSYIDSVCPNPGCFYTPGSPGTCTNPTP